MILAIICVAICVYALGLVAVARQIALATLERYYQPYGVEDYAVAGWLGLLVGAVWPLLAAVIGGSAVIGWLVTRK